MNATIVRKSPSCSLRRGGSALFFKGADGVVIPKGPLLFGNGTTPAAPLKNRALPNLLKKQGGDFGVLVLCFLLGSASGFAQTIQYSIAMPQPGSHEFQIEMTIDEPGMSSVELALPSWSGLYQIRDFSQFIEGLHANVPFRRLEKETWRFDAGKMESIKISCGIFANEWSSFASQLDENHAFFNSADLLLLWKAKRDRPVVLTIHPRDGWQISTSLPPAGKLNTYKADNYDHLVDCPVSLGRLDTYSFVMARSFAWPDLD
jgi:Peptidase M61 N-terminal domain